MIIIRVHVDKGDSMIAFRRSGAKSVPLIRLKDFTIFALTCFIILQLLIIGRIWRLPRDVVDEAAASVSKVAQALRITSPKPIISERQRNDVLFIFAG